MSRRGAPTCPRPCPGGEGGEVTCATNGLRGGGALPHRDKAGAPGGCGAKPPGVPACAWLQQVRAGHAWDGSPELGPLPGRRRRPLPALLPFDCGAPAGSVCLSCPTARPSAAWSPGLLLLPGRRARAGQGREEFVTEEKVWAERLPLWAAVLAWLPARGRGACLRLSCRGSYFTRGAEN